MTASVLRGLGSVPRGIIILALAVILCPAACAPRPHPATAPAPAAASPSLATLHIRLDINPVDGAVSYFGWYDGRRNLLGPGGISAALVGMEPPEFRQVSLDAAPAEIRFTGLDHNRILWRKTYRLDPDDDRRVLVTYAITNRRDDSFNAIIYSLADLPDARISGDNRDLLIQTPIAHAHFHADIQNPNFPGEQMSPYAMRSEARPLGPGQSMDFHMSWELSPARQALPGQ